MCVCVCVCVCNKMDKVQRIRLYLYALHCRQNLTGEEGSFHVQIFFVLKYTVAANFRELGHNLYTAWYVHSMISTKPKPVTHSTALLRARARARTHTHTWLQLYFRWLKNLWKYYLWWPLDLLLNFLQRYKTTKLQPTVEFQEGTEFRRSEVRKRRSVWLNYNIFKRFF
jgi:hypothetical protein